MGKAVGKVLKPLGLGPEEVKAQSVSSTNYNLGKELKPSQKAMKNVFNQSQARLGITDPGQNAVLQQMSLAAQGQGPSLAEVSMRAAQEKNLANQLAATAAGRGGSAAMSQRNLLNNLSAANRDISQQGTIARLAERDSFLAHANTANQQARADIGQRADLDTMNKRSLQGREMANANFAQQAQTANAAASNQLAGALIGGVGAAFAASGGKITKDGVQNFAEGGKVESGFAKALGTMAGAYSQGLTGASSNPVLDARKVAEDKAKKTAEKAAPKAPEAPKAPQAPQLKADGGMVKHYNEGGSVKNDLFGMAEKLNANSEYIPTESEAREFLKPIKKIESNDGKNFNHPVIKDGIHKGQRAIGNYGLMPLTVIDIVKSFGKNAPKDLVEVSKMDPKAMKEFLESRPDLEDKLAIKLASKVLANQKGDKEQAAFAWHQGHNYGYDSVKNKLNDPVYMAERPYGKDYVEKFKKFAPAPAPKAEAADDLDDQAVSGMLNEAVTTPKPEQQVAPKMQVPPWKPNPAATAPNDVQMMQRNQAPAQPQAPARPEPTLQMFNRGGLAQKDIKDQRFLNTSGFDKMKEARKPAPEASRSYDTPAINKKLQDYDAQVKEIIRKEEASRPSAPPKDYNAVDKDGYKRRYAMGGEVTNYQAGGEVDGPGTPTSDSIPAMLSDGEFVIKASVVANPVVEKFLHKLNSGKVSPQEIAKILSKRNKR